MKIDHYIQVTHDNYTPTIILSGNWLEHCEFSIGSKIIVSAKANIINLTTTKSAAFLDFGKDKEKFETYAWLQFQADKDHRLRELLDHMSESFVLSNMMLELLHILFEKRMIIVNGKGAGGNNYDHK